MASLVIVTFYVLIYFDDGGLCCCSCRLFLFQTVWKVGSEKAEIRVGEALMMIQC